MGISALGFYRFTQDKVLFILKGLIKNLENLTMPLFMHAKLSIFRHDCKEGVLKNLVYEKLAHQKIFVFTKGSFLGTRQYPDDIIWCFFHFPEVNV